MTTVSLKEIEAMSVDELLERLESQVKTELKKRPDNSSKVRKLLAQASNYIAAQVA